MRLLIPTAFAPFLALTLAVPVALADVIETTAPVRAATIYPTGASVTRVVDLHVLAGVHQLVIAGLGEATDPATLRVAADGATVGAVSVQDRRAIPADDSRSPAHEAARAEYERLQAALNQRDARAATIRARAQAAQDLVDFLMGMANSDALAMGDLGPALDTVASRLLAAREAVISAEVEAVMAEQGRDRDVEALDAARRRMEALASSASGPRALVLTVQTSGQPARIEITDFTAEAYWEPVYDLRLDSQANVLVMDRGLMVGQATGEDWQGVALTLSTSRPADQTSPSELRPWMPRLQDPVERLAAAPSPLAMADSVGAVARAGAVAGLAESALARVMGAVVVYDYPDMVDLRSRDEALRLRLDSRDLPVELRATAVPQRDNSAFLVAVTNNVLDEVILPGTATLYADGVMAGQDELDLIPAGEEFELGFGPIDGLIAEFEVPRQAEGDRGILTRSNTSSQQLVLRVRNVSHREWDLRVVGQVPVSTQDDLKISWSADPQASVQDPDGQRGLLYWDGTIAAQESHQIAVSIQMSWPEGKVVSGAALPMQR